jgi:protein ImuA
VLLSLFRLGSGLTTRKIKNRTYKEQNKSWSSAMNSKTASLFPSALSSAAGEIKRHHQLISVAGEDVPIRSRSGTEPVSGRSQRQRLVDLQRAIAEIEGKALRLVERSAPADALRLIRFDDPVIDRRLGGGLEADAVHEVKPAILADGGASHAAGHVAATFFALMLAARCLSQGGRAGKTRRQVLWTVPADMGAEGGRLYGPGLRALGVPPEALVIVTTRTRADALWAMEEGLGAGSLALVVGCLDEIGLTPGRRLALAAAAQNTPCLLVTHPQSSPAAATATRWRVAPAGSAACACDPRAPGRPRLRLTLERCRRQPIAAATVEEMVEWCDEAFRFRVASSLSDRAVAARLECAGGGAARPAVRAGGDGAERARALGGR